MSSGPQPRPSVPVKTKESTTRRSDTTSKSAGTETRKAAQGGTPKKDIQAKSRMTETQDDEGTKGPK